MKISIGSDHGGWKLKQEIKKFLHEFQINGFQKIEINDVGCYSEDSCDYPDFAHKIASQIKEKSINFGILICGSGNGINMAANKWSEVRSALCWNKEIAQLARLHNDANIITLPGRFIEVEEAVECVKIFLTTTFEAGRHIQRIEKINP